MRIYGFRLYSRETTHSKYNESYFCGDTLNMMTHCMFPDEGFVKRRQNTIIMH